LACCVAALWSSWARCCQLIGPIPCAHQTQRAGTGRQQLQHAVFTLVSGTYGLHTCRPSVCLSCSGWSFVSPNRVHTQAAATAEGSSSKTAEVACDAAAYAATTSGRLFCVCLHADSPVQCTWEPGTATVAGTHEQLHVPCFAVQGSRELKRT
jgi:hypothetical protein